MSTTQLEWRNPAPTQGRGGQSQYVKIAEQLAENPGVWAAIKKVSPSAHIPDQARKAMPRSSYQMTTRRENGHRVVFARYVGSQN